MSWLVRILKDNYRGDPIMLVGKPGSTPCISAVKHGAEMGIGVHDCTPELFLELDSQGIRANGKYSKVPLIGWLLKVVMMVTEAETVQCPSCGALCAPEEIDGYGCVTNPSCNY